jgi:hypothetical protein
MENLENEIWKPLTTIYNKGGSWEPIEYEISNMGRLRTKRARYGKPLKHTGKRRDLSDYRLIGGRPDANGYIQYAIYNTNKQKRNFRAHTLVMQAFVGLPDVGQIICHYNDIKSDNRLENLRYDTHKANKADEKRNNRKNGM